MNELQQTKVVVAIPPQAIADNAAVSSFVIDRNDFPGCDYLELQGAIGATDIAVAVLKVMESDTKTNSTTLGGTPALVKDSTTKPGAGDDNKTFVFGIDLKKQRERFLQLQCTAGDGSAGTYVSALAIGRRLSNGGTDASDRGLLFAEYA